MNDIVERLRALAPIKEALEAAAEIERLQTEVADANRRIEALERDMSIEIDAGHDSTERAEAAEREIERLRAALRDALSEHDVHSGAELNPSKHWSARARAVLSGKEGL
jgi:chromosome condensin MukBEF ATPase and DNA-binding subunit MukB